MKHCFIKRFKLAGIYIHIPFCKQACYYCNFHFSTSLKNRDKMVSCLIKELELHTQASAAHQCGMILPVGSNVETIYFGGGTPSILDVEEINSLLGFIHSNYRVAPGAEVTLEANPDDINTEKLSGWKKSGINRLSIGIQSFIERDLKWMNRAHNAKQARACIVMAQSSGFDNLSVDLIYGTPGLTDDEWLKNIKALTSLGIPHIASYALTVEPRTALQKMIKLHKKEDVDSEQQARQFELLMNALSEEGYEHYEISNFAKPGMRSKHNSSYWNQKPYLGIGPSAHSFDGDHRYWNVANNAVYMNSIEGGQPFFEMEMLTPVQKMNEYIMTSLRTMEGLSLKYFSEVFSEASTNMLLKKLQNLPANWLHYSDQSIILSREGKLWGDKISAALFF